MLRQVQDRTPPALQCHAPCMGCKQMEAAERPDRASQFEAIATHPVQIEAPTGTHCLDRPEAHDRRVILAAGAATRLEAARFAPLGGRPRCSIA